MDREQEQLQSLGFFGAIKESLKIVFSWKKLFTHISLILIFPLALLYLAQIEISDSISSKFDTTNSTSDTSDVDYFRNNYTSAHWPMVALFNIAYFVIFLVLYLLSTAAVVYTIACIYTAKPTTFKKVMSVVPRVWKRLLVTFLWSFFIAFVYNVVAIGILAVWVVFLSNSVVGIVIGVVIIVLYLVGFVYITIVWQLASVVSVLEEKYGLKAMKKSRNLIKGKIGVAVGILILFGVFYIGIEIIFGTFVVFDWSTKLAISIPVGILCLVLLVLVILFGLVAETIIYFICKSYHHETIDKSSLSDHLEEYLGDYVRLNRSKDVQLEQQSRV